MKGTRHRKLFASAVTLAIVSIPVLAAAAPDRPTYTKDIVPLIQEHCQDCHRASGANVMGMVAPMSFTSYQEVRPWAKGIARQVKARTMPPWHASNTLDGVFKNQRTMTDEEIDTIVRWTETGAVRGRPEDAPRPKVYPDTGGWSIGEPDLVLGFKEPLFVEDDWEDRYVDVPALLTDELLPSDKWIKGMEFRPGSEAVHHIVMFTNDRRESLGFPMGMLGGVGPGTDPSVFPEGYGRLLKKGSTLSFNMHYHKEPGPGTGVWDESEIGFTFQDKPVHHSVSWGAVGSMFFEIPPGESNWPITASEKFTKDTTLLAFFPHMHLRGKATRYVAYYPNGTEEVLLDVPSYDFNWQTNYVFAEPKKIPKGTRIDVTMWYDNSEERAEWAGFDPTRTVRFGQPTWDEMMFGWIDYTDSEVAAPDAGSGGR